MPEFKPRIAPGAVLIELSTQHPRFSGFTNLHNAGMLRADSRFIAARKRVIEDYNKAGYTDYSIPLVDAHDLKSVHFVSQNSAGLVNGALRICRDSKHGLPAAHYAPDVYKRLQTADRNIAEAGRFVSSGGVTVCKQLVSAAFQFGTLFNVDLWLQTRNEHADFYKDHCGAETIGGGTPSGCQNLMWYINKTPDNFYTTFGKDQSALAMCWQTEEILDEAL